MDDCWPPIMKILLALSRPVFPAGKVAFPRLIHPNPGRGTPTHWRRRSWLIAGTINATFTKKIEQSAQQPPASKVR